jgi:hypothetical protein
VTASAWLVAIKVVKEDGGSQHKLLGDLRWLTGDYRAAVQALDEALGTYHDIGTRDNVASALNSRGTLHRVGGELALAEGCHRRRPCYGRQRRSSSESARPTP